MDIFCMGCMEKFSDEYQVCPYCGYIVGTKAAEALHSFVVSLPGAEAPLPVVTVESVQLRNEGTVDALVMNLYGQSISSYKFEDGHSLPVDKPRCFHLFSPWGIVFER